MKSSPNFESYAIAVAVTCIGTAVITSLVWYQFAGQRAEGIAPISRASFNSLSATIEFWGEVRAVTIPEEQVFGFASQDGRVIRIPPDEVTYAYRSILINLSESRLDWSNHLVVELRGATCIQLSRFGPIHFEINEAGSQQVKVDIFRMHRYSYEDAISTGTPRFVSRRVENAGWLIRDGFDHDTAPDIDAGHWGETGFFYLGDQTCTIDIAILVDGRILREPRLRIDPDGDEW